jgi:hypothetical protein
VANENAPAFVNVQQISRNPLISQLDHFTEIRQATEHLYSRCGAGGGVSDYLLGRLDVLNGTAEFVEEYAKDLQSSLTPNNPQVQNIFRECVSILSDLRRLVALIGDDGGSLDADATRLSASSLNEEIIDVRSRLTSLQFNLSHIHNKKIAKDADAIKEAVTELMNGPANADETSSIRTFYTASSIPYVERQMWRELERALRGRFTAEFVRHNYALIVATVEETVWETTTLPVDALKPAPSVATAAVLTNTTASTLSVSERSRTLVEDTDRSANSTTIAKRHGEPLQKEQPLSVARDLLPKAGLRSVDAVRDDDDLASQTEPDPKLEESPSTFLPVRGVKRSASMTALYHWDDAWADKTGRTWGSYFGDSRAERLLTFGS